MGTAQVSPAVLVRLGSFHRVGKTSLSSIARELVLSGPVSPCPPDLRGVSIDCPESSVRRGLGTRCWLRPSARRPCSQAQTARVRGVLVAQREHTSESRGKRTACEVHRESCRCQHGGMRFSETPLFLWRGCCCPLSAVLKSGCLRGRLNEPKKHCEALQFCFNKM